ncbi:MAG: M48 family metallopeptidase [Proteobacteria bacterium]|nr:M48 family metallopeptidase [Pseudomonadota bacterium]
MMIKPLQLALDLFGELAAHGRARASAPALAPPPAASTHDGDAGFVYELRRSARRRSLSIEVHANLNVVVRAPLRFPQREIEQFIGARAPWVAAQLEHFRTLPRMPLVPTYADGATHYYLGLPHRLRLDPEASHGVQRCDDSLVIGGRAARDGLAARAALDAWYRKRAEELFNTILAECHLHPRFQRYPCPALQIRAMRTRWGSLGTRRGMTLNLVLIQAPRECIEFVVMHELCHLRYHGHGKGFYKLLDGVCPDWRERKRLLEDSLR